MASVLSGAVFGAALTASGCAQPAIILAQLRWENYTMLQVFLTATAASALVTSAAQRVGYASFPPRSYADRGWLPVPFDGNIIGGLALGTGMALSGACPGTVLVQVALQTRSGYFALAGAVAGGVVWAVVKPRLTKTTATTTTTKKTNPPPTGLAAALGIAPCAALAGFEAVMVAIVGATVVAFPPGPDGPVVPPVLGGLLIGAAQLVSVALRKSTLGVSTAYEDMGRWLLWAVRDGARTALPATGSILFALGVAAGSRAVVTAFPALLSATPADAAAAASISPALAALGGFVMTVGARLAGGCTSGHGISGMALLSVSSFITIGAVFLGGGLVSLLL